MRVRFAMWLIRGVRVISVLGFPISNAGDFQPMMMIVGMVASSVRVLVGDCRPICLPHRTTQQYDKCQQTPENGRLEAGCRLVKCH